MSLRLTPLLSLLVLAIYLFSMAASEPRHLDGGLIVETLKMPKTCKREAKRGDKLQVHYVGRLDGPDGQIFDASRDRGSTFNFQLGAGQVIQGYELGVPGMCKGETRTLTVPSELGYGDRGVDGVIPGGATLHFTVELMDISDGPRLRDEV